MNTKISYIITKSLENYDKQNKKYKDIINAYNNKEYHIDEDDTLDIITFTNTKNSKIVYKFKWEYLGLFDNQTKMWFWGWSIVQAAQKHKQFSRDLLNYGLDITLDNLDSNKYNTDNLFIRTLLINTKIKFTYEYQLNIFLAICCFISKTNISCLYPYQLHKYNYRYIYYLILKEIK